MGINTELPKFSVAMSIYKNDNPKELDIALKSICEQSLQPNEIYLVIDGPIGESLQSVVDCYCRKYDFFTIKQLEKNGGLGNALKIAVENCKYDLIARMDSDDISAPNRFLKQIQEYVREPVDVLGGWTLGFFGNLDDGEITSYKLDTGNDDIIKGLMYKNTMSHVTVLLNRNAVLKAGNYKDLFYHEDYYLWVRMALAGCSFRNIPEYLVYVRCGENQASRHGGKLYYSAEKFLRKYMLKNGLSTWSAYIKSMSLRFLYQRVFSSKMRCFVDKKIKRRYLSKQEIFELFGK